MIDSELAALLIAFGYRGVRELPTGEIAGVFPLLFTTGLFFGLDENGCRGRYCYEREEDASAALAAWDGRGDPPGPWIKEKPGDRLGPGATGG